MTTLIKSFIRWIFFIFIFLQFSLIVESQVDAWKPMIETPIQSNLLNLSSQTTVNTYTGIGNIVISLYNIQLKDFNIPVSLQYNTSGIQVNQISSWVGLGWNLYTGGKISRIVRGKPDDQVNKGYLYCIEPDVTDPNILYNYFKAKYDTDPDIFMANCAGKSVKFMFNKDGTIQTLSPNDWEISYDTIHYTIGYNTINKFTVITEDGTKYVFADYETTDFENLNITGIEPTTSNPFPTGNIFPGEAPSVQAPYTSSWCLSSVETPNGEVISYEYNNEIVKNEIFFYDKWYFDAYYQDMRERTEYATAINNTKKLNKITWKEGQIQFESNYARSDLQNNDCKALSNIIISNNLNHEIKNLEFNYDYFISLDIDLLPEAYKYLGKRLKLLQIKEINNQSLSLSPYIFYYSQNNLPSRVSRERDFWGYYNSNGASSLEPTIYNYPNDYNSSYNTYNYIWPITSFSGVENIRNKSDRNSNESAAQACILEKVIYPAGGYIELKYELNEFKNPDNFFNLDNNNDEIIDDGIRGAGLRIYKKTISPDGINKQETTYSYILNDQPVSMTSGELISLPKHAYEIGDNFGDHLTIYSNSLNNLQNSNGSFVCYGEVKESSQDNGYTIYRYDLPPAFNDMLKDFRPSPEDEWLFCQDYPLNICSFGTINPYTGDPLNLYIEPCNYNAEVPLSPIPIHDWNSGHLIEQTKFTNINTPISKKIFRYDIDEHYKTLNLLHYSPIFIYPYQLDLGCPEEMGPCYQTINQYFFGFYNYYQTCGWSRLSNIKEYIYDSENLGTYILTSTDLDYDPEQRHKQIKSVEIHQGDNPIIKTTYKFPLDYVPENMDELPDLYHDESVMLLMWKRHMINIPIEIITKKDDKIVNGIITKYDIFPYTRNYSDITDENLILPYKQYKNVTLTPIDETNFSESSVIYLPSFTMDESYKLYINYDAYDDEGNLIDWHNENGIHTSLIYFHTLPMAKVENASFDEIAYTSFEHEMKTFYYEGTVINSNTAKTGKSYLEMTGTELITSRTLPIGIYKVEYWARGDVNSIYGGTVTALRATDADDNGWIFYEKVVELSNDAPIQLMGNTDIDELRIYPSDAKMTTYTYDPLIGMTSKTDPNGLITYYDYDDFGRLVTIRNHDGDILKGYDYHYFNQE